MRMKKVLIIFILVFSIIFCVSVKAENSATYTLGSTNETIKVFKDGATENDEYGVKYFPTSLINPSDKTTANLITFSEDEVSKDNDKWWGSIYVCSSVNTMGSDMKENWWEYALTYATGIGGVLVPFLQQQNQRMSVEYFVYTDTLEISVDNSANDKEISLKKGLRRLKNEFTNEKKWNCQTLSVTGVDKDKQVFTCGQMLGTESRVQEIANDYNNKDSKDYKNRALLTEYKDSIEEMRTFCGQASKFTDWNDGCLQKCLNLEDRIYQYNKQFGIYQEGECGFSARLIAWIMNILKWIKYIIPVAVIILGSLDFIKATASDKDEDVKKAQGNFVKRLIAAALIFLIPLLLEFILPKFGFDYNSCGLF